MTRRLQIGVGVGIGFVVLGLAVFFVPQITLGWWLGVIWMILGAGTLWDVRRELRKRAPARAA